MKKLVCCCILCCTFLCGCDFALEHDDAVLVFSARPITRDTLSPDMIQNTFDKGQLIHYGVYSKEPFNTNEGKIQILKKDPNTQLYGFSLAQGGDICLTPGKNYYTGCFTIYSDGYYLVRIYAKTRPNDPIAQQTFWITQDN